MSKKASVTRDLDPQLVYRRRSLADKLDVHPTTVWRWEQRGDFPRGFYLSPGVKAWYASEIVAWLASRAEDRR